MSSGSGFDARGDWLDPSDQAWLDSQWPVAANSPCTCYDAATLEWAPTPCEHCRKQERLSKGGNAA